ncbi:periaxin isoform X2 [Paroedura picta]|uniref:periaxin isoform X2 n=1 Tax=Paroedura picta TaxID=143630 RepID=UPI00405644C0
MCDCFARVFGVSWAPAADSAAEGHGQESHLSRTRRQAPLAESKRNDPPAPAQIPSGLHSSPLFPEEAADPDRAAQKEKLHAELKRVLQKKGASQASSEEAEGGPQPTGETGAPLLRKMETVETSELLEIIVETEAEAGASGMSVAGGGRQGLFVKDVLKGSPAAQALRLREGDQLLSARVYFDNMKYEDALQILKSAEPYKVSFCLKRTVPSTGVARSPGAPPFEARGPKAKVAKLSIQSLTSLKKKPKKAGKGLAKDRRGEAARGSQELVVAPVDVEFCMPKFSKLRKARSTGEVAAAARPSPDLSPLLSSLETKRRRLKLPRLRVKEALAARAVGRREEALPKAHTGQKAAAPTGAGGRVSRFTVPFSKGKKPKEEEATRGFQAPQVELDFPVPKVGPGRESPKAAAGHKIQVPPLGLPQVEVALPKGSPAGPEAPKEGPLAGLRLPAAEVAAPQVDLALSLPRLEGRPPEVAPRGDGLQLKVPKLGVSAKEMERKPALLDAVVGIGRAAVEGLEEKLAMPSLEVEIPLPRGKEEAEVPRPKTEIPEVSLKVPTVSLPKLGSKAREEVEEEESRVPQLELSVGRRDSPKAEARSPAPSVGFSRRPESREAPTGPAESKMRSLGLKVPSLNISAPRVPDVPLPKSLVGLVARAPEAKAEEAVEGPRFKLQMPQLSLPKCSPPKATPSPPTGPRKPEGGAGGKAGVLDLELDLPTGKPPEVQLPPKGHVPKPELDLSVDRPWGEVALPAARLSFPSATVPALELDLPRAGLELGFPKAESERLQSDRPQRDHEAMFKMPTMGTLSKGLSVEISIPKYVEGEQPEQQPGPEASEGPGLGAMVAKIPQVDLAFSTEAAAAASVGRKGGPQAEGSAKLPSVEISAIKLPQAATESGKFPETEVKLKSPKFALPKFSISGPKAWKVSTELFGAQGESPEAAERGSKLKMPKFGIAFPKSKGGGDAEGPKPALGGERRSPPKEPAESRRQLPAMALPKVEVEVPTLGKDESSSEDGSGTVPELGLELPDIRRKMPKFSLPRFGGKGKEGEAELEKGEKDGRVKASKFKMALFSGMGRGPEGGGLEGADTKTQKGSESPREKTRGPLHKMPSPKAELLHGHISQVELPQLSLPEANREETLLVDPGSPKARVPSLEIAMPGAPTKAEPAPGVPWAGGEAEVRMPQGPSLAVSVPQVELDLSLPSTGAGPPLLHRVPGAEAKIRLPQVELLALGSGEEGAAGGGGERGTGGAAKLWVPQVDLALPKGPPPEGEPPRPEGDGPEGRFQLPSVELTKFPTPKASAPGGSLEGGKVKLSSPAIRLPKFKVPSKGGEGEAEATLPQLELKVPKLGGSSERLGAEAGAAGPCPPSGFGLCQAGGEAEEGVAVSADSKFKLKLPSLSLSKAGPEARADTQPLCPSRKEGDAAFRRPQIALPDVGFSMGQEGRGEAEEEAGKLASVEGPGAEGSEAWGKMPRAKIPAKGGQDDPEGKAFRVPGLELAAPALKAHAEYQVEGAQRRAGGSPEEAGRRARASSDGRKSPRGRGEAADAEAGKKYKGKIPKFTLAWPKAGEGTAGQEGEAKAKRPVLALGRPRGRETEAASGLLEGDEEADGKGVMGRLKLGLSRLKMGPEANGELGDGSSRGGRLPKVGFSHGEGAEAALQNGAQDAKAKLGKIRLPQVELSSPSPTAEGDPELSLELVGGDEAKEWPGAWAALKFKPPQITFSGFRERNGEPGSGALVPSAARTEMASLERAEASRKGEKPPKFKFPKVVLSPKAHRAEEVARGSQEGLKLQVPKVGFSEEAGGIPPQAVAEGKGEATAAL